MIARGSFVAAIGMRIVAEQANGWHLYGPYETLQRKIEVFKQICSDVGRDIAEIQLATNYMPNLINGPDDTLDKYADLGVNEIGVLAEGHNRWDLGLLREVLQWRDARARSAV